jgi:hypothetical protein
MTNELETTSSSAEEQAEICNLLPNNLELDTSKVEDFEVLRKDFLREDFWDDGNCYFAPGARHHSVRGKPQ